jgi:cytoskeletal protein RodZ
MAKRRRNRVKKHTEASGTSTDQTVEEFLASTEGPQTLEESSDEVDEEGKQSERLSNDSQSIEESTIESENVKDEDLAPVVEESLSEESQPQAESTETIGIYLKRERERLGVSIKNISQKTKIVITNLENLEANQLSLLPDKTYVKGYVKSYAQVIGANREYCLDLLENTYQKIRPERPQANLHEQVASSTPVKKERFNNLYIALAVILLVGGIWFAAKQTSSQKERQEQAPSPEKNRPVETQTLNEETPLKTESEVKESDELLADDISRPEKPKKVEVPEVVAKPQQPLETQKKPEVKKEEKKEEQNLAEKEKSEKKEDQKLEQKKFTKIFSSLYSVDSSVTRDEIRNLIPDNFYYATISGKQNVFISATEGDSWLTYKTDDEEIKKFVLKQGRNLLIRGDLIRLFLGNIGAVKVFLNNQPLKIVSKTGVKSLVFPQEDKGKFLLPLFIYNDDGTVSTSDEYIKKQESSTL